MSRARARTNKARRIDMRHLRVNRSGEPYPIAVRVSASVLRRREDESPGQRRKQFGRRLEVASGVPGPRQSHGQLRVGGRAVELIEHAQSPDQPETIAKRPPLPVE